MVFVWIIPLLGVAVGGVLMHDAIRYSTTAPEQAAGAALALCCAVLPYVVARAIEGIVLTSWRAKVLAALKMFPTTPTLRGNEPTTSEYAENQDSTIRRAGLWRLPRLWKAALHHKQEVHLLR